LKDKVCHGANFGADDVVSPSPSGVDISLSSMSSLTSASFTNDSTYNLSKMSQFLLPYVFYSDCRESRADTVFVVVYPIFWQKHRRCVCGLFGMERPDLSFVHSIYIHKTHVKHLLHPTSKK
jgi:hypothetical protein